MHWQVPSGGLAFPVNLLRHWTFSLYYIVSDLWGSAGIPLLFWSCANDLVSLEQVGTRNFVLLVYCTVCVVLSILLYTTGFDVSLCYCDEDIR